MIQHHGVAEALRFIRCTVAGETYCLRMSWIRGIRRAEELQHTESSVSEPMSWLASGEDQIPVYSLATRLYQVHEAHRPRGKILLLNTPPHLWAVLVDRVESIVQVPADKVFPLLPIVGNVARKWFEGIVKYGEELMLALSPEGLHPEAPVHTISSLWDGQRLDGLYTVAAISAEAGAQGNIVLFSTSPDWDITFGLSLKQVLQVLQSVPILTIPGAVSYILGLIEWRGLPMVVIDLSSCLGGAVSPVETDSRLLIVRVPTQGVCIALPIQPQVMIRTLPIAHCVSDRCIPLRESLIQGKFTLEQTTLVVPDIDAMLVSNSNNPL